MSLDTECLHRGDSGIPFYYVPCACGMSHPRCPDCGSKMTTCKKPAPLEVDTPEYDYIEKHNRRPWWRFW